jgi:hypothetical protein
MANKIKIKLTSHMGTSFSLKKKRSTSLGISDGFFM